MNLRRSAFHLRTRANFLVLLALLGLVFLTGGASRSDVSSLIILWPVAGLSLAYALWGLPWGGLRQFPVTFGLLAAALLLTAVQLVPLPPEIWTALPGREFATQLAKISGLENSWQPLSLTPFHTTASMYALVVPLAIAVLAVRCTADERAMLLPALLVIGMFSAALGLIQALGSDQSALYLYRVSSRGFAVGLFANRNHQATFLCCLFPMLATYASAASRSVEQGRFRLHLAIGLGAVLVPLILVTGSRAGFVLMIMAILGSVAIYRRPKAAIPPKRKGGRRNYTIAIVSAIAAGLVVLTYASSRATAVQRLVSGGNPNDSRLAYWQAVWRLVQHYFPVGSGAGSFVEIYQVDEPLGLLAPEYLNHAHNDWLELALTHGLAGALILAIAVLLWIWAAVSLIRARHYGSRTIQFGQLGLIVAGLLGLASVVDYPLRAPSLACLLVLSAIWTEEGAARARRLITGQIGTGEKGGTPSSAELASPVQTVA